MILPQDIEVSTKEQLSFAHQIEKANHVGQEKGQEIKCDYCECHCALSVECKGGKMHPTIATIFVFSSGIEPIP